MKNKVYFVLLLPLLLTCCTKNSTNSDARTVDVFINEGNNFEGRSKDSIWSKIERETNTTINISGATHGSDYYLTLNPKLISPRNKLDIIFCVPSNPNCAYETAIESDMYWNIDELLAMKPDEYPTIEKVIHSDLYKNIIYGDNYHSLIPYPSSRSGWTIYYRSDWLINIGYVDENGNARTPVTIEEFEDVMYKFRNNDPDQNGKKDTYAISPAGSYFYWNPLYHAFGVSPDYDLITNEYGVTEASYMYTQDNFKEYLRWINQIYQDGVIDPDFASNAPNDGDREKFYEGLVGILISNGENHVDWVIPGVEKVQGKGKVCIGTAPVGTKNLGLEGVGGFSDWGGYWGGYSIFKHMNGYDYDYDSAYAALDVLEYLYSQDGGLLRMYGIENTHWSYDENNNIVPTIYNRYKEDDGTFISVEKSDGSKEPSGLYKMGSAWGNRLDWHDDGSFDVVIDNSNMPYDLKDIFNETIEKNNVVSSKLVNFTNYASGFAQSMNLFEDEMDRFAVAMTRVKFTTTYTLDQEWDDEMEELNNNFKWTKIKKMIKEQAKKAGII